MLTTTDLVFEDGVESYLSACREIAEKADNLFMFGSARGGGYCLFITAQMEA